MQPGEWASRSRKGLLPLLTAEPNLSVRVVLRREERATPGGVFNFGILTGMPSGVNSDLLPEKLGARLLPVVLLPGGPDS